MTICVTILSLLVSPNMAIITEIGENFSDKNGEKLLTKKITQIDENISGRI